MPGTRAPAQQTAWKLLGRPGAGLVALVALAGCLGAGAARQEPPALTRVVVADPATLGRTPGVLEVPSRDRGRVVTLWVRLAGPLRAITDGAQTALQLPEGSQVVRAEHRLRGPAFAHGMRVTSGGDVLEQAFVASGPGRHAVLEGWEWAAGDAVAREEALQRLASRMVHRDGGTTHRELTRFLTTRGPWTSLRRAAAPDLTLCALRRVATAEGDALTTRLMSQLRDQCPWFEARTRWIQSLPDPPQDVLARR